MSLYIFLLLIYINYQNEPIKINKNQSNQSKSTKFNRCGCRLCSKQIIEEGDNGYPTEDEEEVEEDEVERVATELDVEGVELIASYW